MVGGMVALTPTVLRAVLAVRLECAGSGEMVAHALKQDGDQLEHQAQALRRYRVVSSCQTRGARERA